MLRGRSVLMQLLLTLLPACACVCVCVRACTRMFAGREWDVPVEVFDSIETLLPTGKDLFLELWAPTQAGRAGWTHVVEQQQGV